MTKKDHELFATKIRERRENFRDIPFADRGFHYNALIFMEARLMEIFKEDNPKFDAQHFLDACQPRK